MATVVVTNKNEEAYSRKFDGDLYSFPPGEAMTIPESAAAYLFAYGLDEEDRKKIVVRNGWQRNGMPNDPQGPEAAMTRLKNFVFRKGPEGKAESKPEKKVLPGQGREPTGINAINPKAKDNGRTILPRSGLRLPGSVAPMGDHLPPAV